MAASRVFLLCSVLLGAAPSVCAQEPATGPQAARLEADRVILEDGAVLPLTQWLPTTEAPRAILVALHGMNEYSAFFAQAGAHLAAHGYAVYAYDQRGFGATEQHGRWAGGDVLAADARRVAELVRARNPNVPLYMLGESLGGTVLLHALAQEPLEWLDGAVLLAPAVWGRSAMPWYQRFGLALVSHTFPGMKVSRPDSRDPSDDPETLRSLREDPLVIKKMRVDVLRGAADLMDEVTAGSSEFGVPLLILYGARDRIIPPVSICRWVASLDPGGPWQLAVYPDGWHLLLRDLDWATTMADLTAWLAATGGPLPPGFEGIKPLDETSCLELVGEGSA